MFKFQRPKICLVYGKRLSRKSNTVVFLPFAFRISVKQLYKTLWSLLLLQDHENSGESFAPCCKSLQMLPLPATEELMSEFPSPRHPSSPGSYTLDLSGLGDPTDSSATAGLALRSNGNHKILHNSQFEIRLEGMTKIP